MTKPKKATKAQVTPTDSKFAWFKGEIDHKLLRTVLRSKPKKAKLPDVWVSFDESGVEWCSIRKPGNEEREFNVVGPMTRYVPYQKSKTCRWKWVPDPGGGQDGYYSTGCNSIASENYGNHCHDCGGRIVR